VNAIDTGLYSKMTGNAPLVAGITGIYNIRAPEGTSYGTKPYLVFQWITGTRDWAFTGTTFDDALYQIDIWAPTITAAGTALDLLITALDWQTLTISGYTGVYCRLETVQKMFDPDTDAARMMTEWRVKTQK